MTESKFELVPGRIGETLDMLSRQNNPLREKLQDKLELDLGCFSILRDDLEMILSQLTAYEIMATQMYEANRHIARQMVGFVKPYEEVDGETRRKTDG